MRDARRIVYKNIEMLRRKTAKNSLICLKPANWLNQPANFYDGIRCVRFNVFKSLK